LKFFPDPARRDEIKFLFMKSLPYNKRVALIACFMAAGLSVQLFLSFWPGWFLLAIATAMSLVRGYDSTPKATSKSEKWDQVTPDEYTKVKCKQKDLARWDLDAFDITNPLGGTVFVLLVIAVLLVWLALRHQPGRIGEFWALDCLILLAPHWVTGVRRYLRQDRLLIKIKLLEKVVGEFTRPSDIQVLPMLATQATHEDKRLPTDARLMLRLVGAPDAFLGIQVQIAINSLQGADYPYLYCVLLAREEAKCFAKVKDVLKTIPDYRGSVVTIEQKNEKEVDVLVIRQTTKANSGYCTKPAQAIFIVRFAVNMARRICHIGQTPGGAKL
jgi:hypothetical protein